MSSLKMFFGRPNGPHPRLYSLLIDQEVGMGLSYIWENFLKAADDELMEDILSSLQNGGKMRNIMLISAICFGHDGMTSPIGKNGVKRTARRFTYHAIATVDIVARLEGVQDRLGGPLYSRECKELISLIQHSYLWLTPPSKSRPVGPLTEMERDLATAYCIVGNNGRNGEKDEAIRFLATNLEALDPYIDLISSTEDITLDALVILSESKPALAIASGAL